jgi:hypothetical protein
MLPLFIRKFIVDFIETAFAAVIGLVLIFPTSLNQATQEAAVVGIAILGAAISAIRRDGPDFFYWLQTVLGYTPNEPTPTDLTLTGKVN